MKRLKVLQEDLGCSLRVDEWRKQKACCESGADD